MVFEMIFFGACALLTLVMVTRGHRKDRENPDYAERPDSSAPGWGGAGASD